MSTMNALLQSPSLALLGVAMIHFLWQGALIALTANVALVFLRRHSAETRYWTVVGFLLLMIAAPIATLFAQRRSTSDHPNAFAATNTSAETHASLPNPVASTSPPTVQSPTPSTTASGIAFSLDGAPWGSRLACAWLFGVLLMSLRFTSASVFAFRLRWCGVSTPDNHINQLASTLARRLNVWQPWSIRVSTIAKSPLVVGCFRPLILLPATALTHLTATELEAILLHELAHIRRFDLWINFLQALTETLLFFHPAVWWLSRKINEERENCCDDLAAAAIGNREIYAKSLLALAELPRHHAAFTAAMQGGSLTARIRRLYEAPTTTKPHALPAIGSLLLLSIAILLIIASTSALAPSTTVKESPVATVEAISPTLATSLETTPTEATKGDLRIIVRITDEPAIVTDVPLQLWYASEPDKSSPRPTSEWIDAKGVAWNTIHSSHKVLTGEVAIEPPRAGRFRVSARIVGSGDKIASAFSEPFDWSPETEPIVREIIFPVMKSLRLQFVDKASRKPIEGAEFRVFDLKGDVIHGDNPGRVSLATNKEGNSNELMVAPGKYAVEVIGKKDWSYRENSVDYAGLDERFSIEIAREFENRKTIELEAKPLSAAEIESRWPWIVQGEATDESGKPLSGIDIHVATGMGTLLGGSHTKTRDDGTYIVRFSQGIHMAHDEVQLQYAIVSARSDEFCEENLSRHGSKWMARKKPSDEALKTFSAKPEDIFLPGTPMTIDFVMEPAEAIRGIVVDDYGTPLYDHSVALDTDPLPPASSVFAQVATNEKGGFEFKGLPADQSFQLSVGTPRNRKPHLEAMSETLSFDKSTSSKRYYRVRYSTREDEARPKLVIELIAQ
jgi:beta-lactamase regulating signal transducer with metallopeptidase domain